VSTTDPAAVERLEALLEAGRDDALLRFSLGAALLRAAAPERAALHLARAVEHDPAYSAAWKLYAKALAASHRDAEAGAAYRAGIATAEARGDIQAAKERRVFLRRVGDA